MLKIPDETIRRSAEGDIGAFEDIYRISSRYVYSVAYRVTGSHEDAQEVTQDVFIKIHKKLGTFSFRSAFSTWLYRITMNTAINLYRKRSREKGRNIPFDDGLSAGKEAPSSGDVTRGMEQQENEALVMSMLASLPEKQKACIVLRELQGLKYEEVAEILGVNINTVKSRLSRAREKLMSIYRKGRK